MVNHLGITGILLISIIRNPHFCHTGSRIAVFSFSLSGINSILFTAILPALLFTAILPAPLLRYGDMAAMHIEEYNKNVRTEQDTPNHLQHPISTKIPKTKTKTFGGPKGEEEKMNRSYERSRRLSREETDNGKAVTNFFSILKSA